MKNNITKDIEYMKYVLGYKRGVVISEQPIKKTSLSEQNNNEKPPVGCIDGDCESGEGTYKYSNGAEYTGKWEGGKRNGKGTNKYSSGAVYTGEWKEDKQDGPGGTFKTSKGTVYTGEFKDNKLLNGQVIYKLSNGNSRYGEWTNGVQGELKDGKPPEQNKETEQNNDQSTTGCVTGNCEDGKGTYKWSDGTVYTGLWKDSKHNGKGSYKFADGTTEETGEFKNNDLYNGYKIFSDFYYEVINGVKGEYIDGKPPEQTKEIEQDNNQQQSKTGECTGNCKDGEGTYKDKDRVYSGKFKDGDLYNGIITFTSQDGNSKYSEVKDGVQGKLKDGEPPNNAIIDPNNAIIDSNNATVQTNSGDCKEPTAPTHRYKNDRNYRYAKSGDCWWAKNIINNKWINLTELVKTKPKVQSSIDKLDKGLENGTDLIKL